jgi:hypothetical protein
MKKIIKIFLLFFWLNIFFLPFYNNGAQAAGAVLFASPNSGSYTLGKSITVKIMVDSGGGVGINAAEGVITYDPAFLTVSNLSKTSSIFNLWTTNNGEGPGYSNTSGKINFGGGSSNAYKGNSGTIFSVTFNTKKIGTANVNFSSGIILAADGKGTNVFSSFGNASFTIKEAATTAETKEATVTKTPTEVKTENKGLLPPLPEVQSPTHPDENIWYANNNPEFTWKILSDLTNVNYSISTDPAADPGLTNEGITESKKFEKVNDGLQYFNIKYQNKSGWGLIAHKKFMVDATPPNKFSITIDNDGDTTNPTPKIRFKTTDETSGLESYNIIIGSEAKKVKPEDVADGFYQPSPLAPGEYTVSVAAYDKAQNAASSSSRFIIDPLKPPIITSMPKTMNKNDELIIQGTSFYPQVTVKIYIAKNEKDIIENAVKTDDQGNWSYFHKGILDKGNYEVWAKIIDNRGAQSSDSTKNLLIVVSSSIISSYGWLIILILLIIIAFLLLYIVYLKKEFKLEKTRIRDETDEVKIKLRKIFAALREEVDELIELADKKAGLSESEKRIKDKLQESLDIAEEFLSKEVNDVEKEIKLPPKDLVHK